MVINGREYSGHALDRMQQQGIMPSASFTIAGYRSGSVSLRQLLDDLDAVWNNLPSSERGEEFRSHWWTLEEAYAVALDRGELAALPADAQADIDEAVGELERLMGSWPLPPEAVV